MRASLGGLLIAAGASTIIAIGVLVAGVGLTASVANQTNQRHGQTGSVGPACLEALATVPDGSAVAGRASLCTGSHGIQASLRVYGLVEGQPYTAWLAYTRWRNPDAVVPGASIEADADLPETPLRPLGERVAPESGELEFHGDFPDAQAADLRQVTLFLADPDGNVGALAHVSFDLVGQTASAGAVRVHLPLSRADS